MVSLEHIKIFAVDLIGLFGYLHPETAGNYKVRSVL